MLVIERKPGRSLVGAQLCHTVVSVAPAVHNCADRLRIEMSEASQFLSPAEHYDRFMGRYTPSLAAARPGLWTGSGCSTSAAVPVA